MDPHTTVFRTSFGNKTTVVENGRRALHIKDEPVVLYLGERQRIPDHYTFFKVLWQERPWWIYYQEVVFSYCFGRPAVYPPDYNYPTQLG